MLNLGVFDTRIILFRPKSPTKVLHFRIGEWPTIHWADISHAVQRLCKNVGEIYWKRD